MTSAFIIVLYSTNFNVNFTKRKMYDLIADVDVHARLYIIKGLLEVSSSGRSEVTGITVSLKERETTIRSLQPLTDQEEPITRLAAVFNYQEGAGSPQKRTVNKIQTMASFAFKQNPKRQKKEMKRAVY